MDQGVQDPVGQDSGSGIQGVSIQRSDPGSGIQGVSIQRSDPGSGIPGRFRWVQTKVRRCEGRCVRRVPRTLRHERDVTPTSS